jgi:hypothetical protein
MDHNATAKTVTRGASSKTYYLKDYISSCEGRIARALEMAEPQARKWCAYRHTKPRIETLCREWEQNKTKYIASMKAADGLPPERWSSLMYGFRAEWRTRE